ncbi:MAG: phosphohistidine phosphatase SixA [Kofleriaceae bacterium]
MKLYLIRHGEAVSEDDAGSDRDRWLNANGREAARVLGRLLRETKIEPDAIVCSPLPRAVQTAELIAQSLDFFGVIQSLRPLEPSARPEVAAREVLASGLSVIVVGHEPSISALGAHLLGRPSFPPFRTAQCCAIENQKPTFMVRTDLAQVIPYFVD